MCIWPLWLLSGAERHQGNCFPKIIGTNEFWTLSLGSLNSYVHLVHVAHERCQSRHKIPAFKKNQSALLLTSYYLEAQVPVARPSRSALLLKIMVWPWSSFKYIETTISITLARFKPRSCYCTTILKNLRFEQATLNNLPAEGRTPKLHSMGFRCTPNLFQRGPFVQHDYTNSFFDVQRCPQKKTV